MMDKLKEIIKNKLENAQRDYAIKYKESQTFKPNAEKTISENMTYSLCLTMIPIEIKGQIEAYQDVLSVIQMLEDQSNDKR